MLKRNRLLAGNYAFSINLVSMTRFLEKESEMQ